MGLKSFLKSKALSLSMMEAQTRLPKLSVTLYSIADKLPDLPVVAKTQNRSAEVIPGYESGVPMTTPRLINIPMNWKGG